MSTWTIRFVGLAAVVIALAVLGPAAASAGQFTVASCQADRLGFSTTAFDAFATRGMRIRRACNPEGPGIRGLVTTNIPRPGSVPRGSVALASVAAPAGTSFTTFAGPAQHGAATAATRCSSSPTGPASSRCRSRMSAPTPTALAVDAPRPPATSRARSTSQAPPGSCSA